ncbi:hypothetical protein GCM10022222_52070 [Amycolatopsis ultiminotia]|uniref:TrbL/VirB6 plasmid conjugal transfer protein n=1 Tax=Amycolatopsis ultiminotia TaxID=543629 RepID=A0ABP6X9Z6_9PSEU
MAGEAAVVAARFDWLAEALGGGAGWLIEAMGKVFDTTTLVDVATAGFTSVYNLVFGMAVFLVLIFFRLQLITGLIRRDPTALSRAVLGAFVVVTLPALALEIVDQLCIGIVRAAGETIGTTGDKVILLAAGLTGINIAAPGVGAIVLAGLMIAAVAIMWFSLLIRKALLPVGVVLVPVVIFLLAITQIATHRRRHHRDHRHGPQAHRRVRPVHRLPVHVVHRVRRVPADGRRAGSQECPSGSGTAAALLCSQIQY